MGWRDVVAGSKELTALLNDLQDRTNAVERFHDLPTGALLDFAGAKAPAGFLLCDGSAYSRVDYSGLFLAIGTVWGSGDGSTTFNVPDLRALGTIGAGTNGAVATSARALAAHGGEETHRNLAGESGMVAHNHPNGSGSGTTTTDYPDHAHNITIPPYVDGSIETPDWTLGDAGNQRTFKVFGTQGVSGATARHQHDIFTQAAADAVVAHNNMQPYAVVTKIIRF